MRDGGSIELDALAGRDMRRGIIVEDSQGADFVDGICLGPVEQSRRVSGDGVSLIVISLQPESGIDAKVALLGIEDGRHGRPALAVLAVELDQAIEIGTEPQLHALITRRGVRDEKETPEQ